MWHNPNEISEEELRVLLVNMLYSQEHRKHFYDEQHMQMFRARHRDNYYDRELEVPQNSI